MLGSLAAQTVLPQKAVLVNDNSTDDTLKIAEKFASQHRWLEVAGTDSQNAHMPGSKVVRAFGKGMAQIGDDFDVIVKLDADLILPPDYFEKVLAAFALDEKTGMVGGFAYIEKNGEWVLENLTDKDHIRGALKAYRKECFADIGGLKPAMGWDTADELLAKFYGWKVVTLPELQVKHLKPTGAAYDKSARFKQGEAFYTLGYGFWIAAIASAKLAAMKRKPLLFLDYMQGFVRAKAAKRPMLVSDVQARFIRNLRWKKMKSKIFG
jgi:glycosyltransferase involved in cell wall biosynthesis